MVNLTIRLNSKGVSTPAAGTPSASGSTPGITAGAPSSTTQRLVCGPHLTLSDLPLASGVGLVPSVHSESTAISGLGVKVRRHPGNKVHFCVRCNFPIAIYGRLDPCEHVFCLICAKKDTNCYLCEERILRIHKIELLEGIFVCGALGCLRSFLSKPEFEWHVKDAHLDLLPSREGPASKLIDGLEPQQSLGGNRDPSSSPSQQSHPPSPRFNAWRQENAAPRTTSPAAEKQAKPHMLGPHRDPSEPLSKRKKPEVQSATGLEKEKDKERDSHRHWQRDREHGQWDRDQSVREREPSQRDRERDRDRDRERERDTDRDRDRDRDLQTQSHRDRDRELWEQQQLFAQQQHPQQQGNVHYPLPPPPPPPPPPFQSNAHPPDRLTQAPPNQQGGTPGPYPPQPFPPFHPQQQDNRSTPRYDSSRHPPFLDPRMAVPPDYQESNVRGRHPQQEGERPRNMPHQQQEGFGLVMDRQGLMLPHFHGEFGAPPMGMMIGPQGMQGMNRFQDGGHGGAHLPPPPKRGNFGPGGESGMGHPQHMFGWGGPANFGVGPGHPQFMNWQPPQ